MDNLVRKSFSQEIDVKATLHVYAEKLIRLADQEKAIRSSRRYRRAILLAFKDAKAKKANRVMMVVLASMAATHLNATSENYRALVEEIQQHIRLNRGRYLRIVQGNNGGVELIRPTPPIHGLLKRIDKR